MRVSSTRCQESMNYIGDSWTVEGRLRTSDAYKGLRWGTCIACGKKHYDTPYNQQKANLTQISVRVSDGVLKKIDSARGSRTRSHLLRTIIQESEK